MNNTISMTEDLILTDGTYSIVGTLGQLLKLRNQTTGEYSTASLGDLRPRLLEPPTWAPVQPRGIENCPIEERHEAEVMASHIMEFVSGIRPGHDKPRKKYDPALTTLNGRVETKAKELRKLGWPASRASLMRKRMLFEQGGVAALLDGRRNRRVEALGRANDEVIDAIQEVFNREYKRSTKTQKNLHTLVQDEIDRRFAGLPDEKPELPSRATVYRHFNLLTAGKHATGKATTRRSLENRPKRTYKTAARLLPGEEVQVDSTMLDFLVRVPGLDKPIRPILTVLIDVATRTVVAFTLRIDAAKGYDHALLLAQALVPFESRPDRTLHRKLVQARHPEYTLLGAAERNALERTRPFIFPRRIMTDNGKDFLSTVFTSACRKYGIDVTTSATRTPTDKGIVERNFRSIHTLLLQQFPGYVGDSTVNRGYEVEKEDLLDLETLTELLDDWFLNVWQNRPHKGNRDPFAPSVHLTPNQAYDAAIAYSGAISIPLDENDFIDLMPSSYRILGAVGVEFKNRQYDSAELHPYRGKSSNLKSHGYKWEVKYNPYDVMQVWVSIDGRWVRCPWRMQALLDQPHFGDIAREKAAPTRPDVRNEIAKADAARVGTPMVSGPDATTEPVEELPIDVASLITQFDDLTFI